MIIAILGAATLAYVSIGAWAITRGPLAEGLRRFRWNMSFGPSLQAWKLELAPKAGQSSPAAVSPWRTRTLGLAVHAGTMMGWPMFLPEAWRAEREQHQANEQ